MLNDVLSASIGTAAECHYRQPKWCKTFFFGRLGPLCGGEIPLKMKKIFTFIFVLCLTVPLSADVNGNAGLRIVDAARIQIGKTIFYDPSYRVLGYPNGDVPMNRGVCTDVVIRAFRSALNMDLQQLVHEDMKRNFSRYPQKWGLKRPDKNIDHRRVPNLETFLKRQGWSLKVTDSRADYLPGDLVTGIVPPHLPHIMIVSDKKNRNGRPLVIHNIGSGVLEEDRLFEFELTGHYRIITTKEIGYD